MDDEDKKAKLADDRWQDDAEIAAQARDNFEVVGDLEFATPSKVSRGNDNGAYVQAWKWFSFEGTKWDKNKEE